MPEKTEILAKVSVDLPIMSLDRVFDYKIPEKLSETLKTGHIVEIPFGRIKKKGIVVGFADEQSEYSLKYISGIVDEIPEIGNKEIELAAYMQKRYVASFHECLKLMCPPGIFSRDEVIVRITNEGNDKAFSKNAERVFSFISEEGGETTLASPFFILIHSSRRSP